MFGRSCPTSFSNIKFRYGLLEHLKKITNSTTVLKIIVYSICNNIKE